MAEHMLTTDRSVALSLWSKAVLFSGVAAGLFDAVYFFGKAVAQGQALMRPLHNIAAFWLGNTAFSHGVTSAALGFAMHIGLSIVMAGGFGVIVSFSRSIRHRPWMAGPVYGLFLYLIMYRIVLPWRWPSLFPQFSGQWSVLDILIHLLFGLIIALVFSAMSKNTKA